jgi:hypothetical protein
MIKKLACRLSLAVALTCLAISANQSFAQSTTSSSPRPAAVTGTNPEPQAVTGTNPEPQTVVALIVLSVILGS